MEADVQELIESKTAEELDKIEKEINGKLGERSFLLDLQYWETILKRIRIVKAEKHIKEQYESYAKSMNIEQKAVIHQTLAEEYLDEAANNQEGDYSPVYYDRTEEFEKLAIAGDEYPAKLTKIWDEKLKRQIQGLKQGEKNEKSLSELDTLQATMRFSLEGNDYDKVAQAMYKQEKDRPMGDDEEPFNEPVQTAFDESIDPTEQKYMLKKPLFFNRVKVGYEWNRYHQTHSDPDNPPPKVVQGYKFNVFYPHLIDRSRTPQFFLRTSDIPGTLILRFHAGPPYEDIAFRIQSKEWDLSEKRGFKCVFDRGILHLHFNFKKLRYRR